MKIFVLIISVAALLFSVYVNYRVAKNFEDWKTAVELKQKPCESVLINAGFTRQIAIEFEAVTVPMPFTNERVYSTGAKNP